MKYLQVKNHKSKTRNQNPETKTQKPKTRTQKPKTKTRNYKSYYSGMHENTLRVRKVPFLCDSDGIIDKYLAR